MRLIDADALMQTYAKFVAPSNNSDFEKEPTWNDAVSLLESAPTVDAVEVVQCKNCKYYDGEYHYCDNDVWAIPNGYCHHGERREDADK